MIDPMQSAVKQVGQRIRALLAQPREKSRHRTLQLRECGAWPKDMPWYPRVPKLMPEDLELLRWLRQELSSELGRTEIINDSDLLYLALRELELVLRSADREEKILKLRFQLMVKENRV